jgi:hypothetical protein
MNLEVINLELRKEKNIDHEHFGRNAKERARER